MCEGKHFVDFIFVQGTVEAFSDSWLVAIDVFLAHGDQNQQFLAAWTVESKNKVLQSKF